MAIFFPHLLYDGSMFLFGGGLINPFYSILVQRKSIHGKTPFWIHIFYPRSNLLVELVPGILLAEVDTADNFGEIGGSISALDGLCTYFVGHVT